MLTTSITNTSVDLDSCEQVKIFMDFLYMKDADFSFGRSSLKHYLNYNKSTILKLTVVTAKKRRGTAVSQTGRVLVKASYHPLALDLMRSGWQLSF
jgi:hypothetical protein